MTFENDFVFLEGGTESDLGDPIYLGHIMPNTVYGHFQKKIWVSDKQV